MPRKPRIEYPGAVYHVMCRGNRREAIYLDDDDRKRFLETLGEASERTGWRVHAYVLMGNHYHLLLETPEPNLVFGMRWFQGTYTARFNARHRLSGHLFQGRYKALLVDPEERGYFLKVSSYIHLNPVRAKLIHPEKERLRVYPWSSYPAFLKSGRNRPDWLEVDRVLGELGLMDNPSGRRRYGTYMDERSLEAVDRKARKEMEADWKKIRRGWYLGSESFRDCMQEKVADALSGKKPNSFSGRMVKEHHEAAALEMLRAGLAALDLQKGDLEKFRKLDHRKQVLAWWVRKQTTVSNGWVSRHLVMGNEGNISKVVKSVEEGRSRDVRSLKRKLGKIPKSGD